MTEDTARRQLEALASNLASLWTGGRAVLERLVTLGGRDDISPWAALQMLPDAQLEAIWPDRSGNVQPESAPAALNRYLAAETWFDRAVTRDSRLAALVDAPVAYFCMEYGLASWLPIYSGGLGILAGDMLKEASDLGLPFVGVGLFYRRGFFHQVLDERGYQGERQPVLDPRTLPVEPVLDGEGREIRVEIPIEGRAVRAGAWRLRVGRVALFLLDTDVPENREEDRAITESLYSGDASTRIRQEMVLGIGGARLLRRLGIRPSIYSMNEGHAAFLGLELLADELGARGGAESPDTLSAALDMVRSRVVYTNHTVVAAGNDVFPRGLVDRYLSGYVASRGMRMDDVQQLGGADRSAGFSMTLLAFAVAGKANAVSRLHADVIPREWPGHQVETVTNGVHVPTWLGDEVRALLDRYVADWDGDEPDWEKVQQIPMDELAAARGCQRRQMVDLVNERQQEVRLDPDVLTLAWARRFAEYKRACLLVSDLERLARILANEARPVQLVIAGKAHPRDEGGKRMLQDLLQTLRSDPRVSARVAFVEDYDEQVARYLTAGADVWVNTPRKPFEASGTSGMKSSDNGGIQLTVRDGWADEVDWWNVGWGIEGRDDAADAAQLYDFLETGIVPTFYDRSAGVSPAWAAMMKNTMTITLSRYSARRTLLEYLQKLYCPLLERQARSDEGVAAAGRLATG